MPLSHVSKVFAVTDAKIAFLTSDLPGATPVYGTSLDIPGVQSFKISGNVDNKVLRGDNAPLDSDTVMQDMEVEVSNAKLSLDVLAGLLGLTTTDSGTTPAQIASMAMTGVVPIKFGRFKLSGVSASADPVAGNVSIILAKCVLSKFPDLGFAEEDYQMATWSARCFPTLGTGQKWLDIAINETAVVLT